MNNLKQFLKCCGAIPNESEITINMQTKKRSISYEDKSRKSYIKRSVGKNPILDLSAKHTNSSTVRSLGGSANNKSKLSAQKNKIINTVSSLQFTIDSHQKLSPKRDFAVFKQVELDNNKSRMDVQNFINYHDYNQPQSKMLLENQDQHIFQPYEAVQIKRNPPRQFYDRRSIKIKEPEQMKNVFVPNLYVDNRMRTILETIEERSSIPSMEESQMYQMRQISSKGTLQRSQIQERERKYYHTPLVEPCKSSTITENNNKTSLIMIRSQNLLENRQNPNLQLETMLTSKLQMENRILEGQLKGLIQEQHFLTQQRSYVIKQFQQQLRILQQTKDEFQSKLVIRHNEIDQIKELINSKLNSQII